MATPATKPVTADVGLARFYLRGQILMVVVGYFQAFGLPWQSAPTATAAEPPMFGMDKLFLVQAMFLLCHLMLGVGQIHEQVSVRRAIRVKAASLCLFFTHVGIVSASLYTHLGPSHFDHPHPPGRLEWVWYIASHVLHAADLPDALHQYGVRLQTIRPVSVESRIALTFLYVATGFFFGRVVLALVSGEATLAGRGRSLGRWAGRLGLLRRVALAGVVLAFLITAAVRGWAPADWIAWPAEQALRAADVADVMQLWNLHVYAEDSDVWASTLAVLCRLLVGLELAVLLVHVQMRYLGALGVPTPDLIARIRQGEYAAEGLAQLHERVCQGAWTSTAGPPEARKYGEDIAWLLREPGVDDPALLAGIEALKRPFVRLVCWAVQSQNVEGREEAVWLLGIVGPSAAGLAIEEWVGHVENRRAPNLPDWDKDVEFLTRALNRMQGERDAAPALRAVILNKAQAVEIRRAAARVLLAVAPEEYRRLAKRP